MAEVFVGTILGAEGFARQVAIKRLLPGMSADPAIARMFITEAQLAARLSHPNIVSVLDFARDPEDRLVLFMEYVDGTDLATALAAGPIPAPLACFLAIETLRALAYAHDLADPERGTNGLIHRDISPQNLLLSHEGEVKVADFGLARVRAATAVQSATVRGKPSYMSPEQISGDPLDGRCDLYAVGVMLWEMLARRPLFAGTSKEIMAQALFKDVPAPSHVREDVPPDLEMVAMTLIARERDARFATAAQAIAALLACRDVPLDGRGALVAWLAERVPRRARGVSNPGSIVLEGGDHAEL